MRHHFFLHYGWFLQNLGKEAVRTNMHTTVKWSPLLSLLYLISDRANIHMRRLLEKLFHYQMFLKYMFLINSRCQFQEKASCTTHLTFHQKEPESQKTKQEKNSVERAKTAQLSNCAKGQDISEGNCDVFNSL